MKTFSVYEDDTEPAWKYLLGVCSASAVGLALFATVLALAVWLGPVLAP